MALAGIFLGVLIALAIVVIVFYGVFEALSRVARLLWQFLMKS